MRVEIHQPKVYNYKKRYTVLYTIHQSKVCNSPLIFSQTHHLNHWYSWYVGIELHVLLALGSLILQTADILESTLTQDLDTTLLKTENKIMH